MIILIFVVGKNKQMQCTKVTRDFTFSRAIVGGVLTTYVEDGISVKNPVQCLDLSANSEESHKWIKKHGEAINVISSTPYKSSIGFEQKTENGLEMGSESNYVLIEKSDFNFIYVECTTEGSSYFDCVFRKIARNGLFAICTIDDPAFYGRPAEPALRCYAGHIVRTFYASELAIRLVIAAMARSAARFSKSVEVLFSAVIKNSLTIILKVKKGAESAVKCLKEIKLLIHCTICEERAFLPDNDGYIIDDKQKYLSCDCGAKNVGRTMLELGPLWAGAIGSPSLVNRLLPHMTNSLHVTTFLNQLLTELKCDGQMQKELKTCHPKLSDSSPNHVTHIDINDALETNLLKRKADDFSPNECKKKPKNFEVSDPEPAPAFYYNLHKHKPKGAQKLMKVDKIIELLHQLGYRASRTHFDRAAIKTNCSLCELQKVLCQVL